MFNLIAFDADDTLWDNETFYQGSIDRFTRILAPYATPETLRQRLDQTEARNIGSFGYGIKSFVLSMIETAVEISDHTIPAPAILQIIDLGKGMLTADMTPLPGVEDTLRTLSQHYRLMMITKGDLMDQEAKLARSGLERYFNAVEVVSEKTPEIYQRILTRHAVTPDQFMMIGNSLKSDIWPVIQLGGWAVYVPHALTWSLELHLDGEITSPHFFEIPHIADLPALVKKIEEER